MRGPALVAVVITVLALLFSCMFTFGLSYFGGQSETHVTGYVISTYAEHHFNGDAYDVSVRLDSGAILDLSIDGQSLYGEDETAVFMDARRAQHDHTHVELTQGDFLGIPSLVAIRPAA